MEFPRSFYHFQFPPRRSFSWAAPVSWKLSWAWLAFNCLKCIQVALTRPPIGPSICCKTGFPLVEASQVNSVCGYLHIILVSQAPLESPEWSRIILQFLIVFVRTTVISMSGFLHVAGWHWLPWLSKLMPEINPDYPKLWFSHFLIC